LLWGWAYTDRTGLITYWTPSLFFFSVALDFRCQGLTIFYIRIVDTIANVRGGILRLSCSCMNISASSARDTTARSRAPLHDQISCFDCFLLVRGHAKARDLEIVWRHSKERKKCSNTTPRRSKCGVWISSSHVVGFQQCIRTLVLWYFGTFPRWVESGREITSRVSTV